MKLSFWFPLLLILLLLGCNETQGAVVPSASNVVELATSVVGTNTVDIAKTNMTSIMIDILSGVRDAGKDIYGVTKDAIRTSVDFVKEQAPDVVQQFLKWQIAKHSFYGIAFLLFAVGLIFTARYLRKSVLPNIDRDYNDYNSGAPVGFTWVGIVVCRIGACLLLVFGLGSNLMDVTKIAIAPKVYIIEYVVDTMQPSRPH